MIRQPWHDSLLESLAVLADIPLQSRVWIDGDDTIFLESPTELICQVFDDSDLVELLEAGPVFSKEADGLLQQLNSQVQSINLEQPPNQLLADPAWVRCTNLASKARESITGTLSAETT